MNAPCSLRTAFRILFIVLGLLLFLVVHFLFMQEMTAPKAKTEAVNNIQESRIQEASPRFFVKVEPVKLRQNSNAALSESVEQKHIQKHSGQGKIVIVIDDMGVDKKRSAQMVNIGAPLTLSYLPYANNVEEQATIARAKGHEIMAHIPMMPQSRTIDPGPDVLTKAMSSEDITRVLKEARQKLGDIQYINNHMGSAFTQDISGMERLFSGLEQQELSFLDSRTTAATKSPDMAKKYDVSLIERDVFLDHEPTPEFVNAALQKLEDIAKTRGYAIAIGHPKDVTYQALKAWLPSLRQKNIELVSLSDIEALEAPAIASTD